jgi:hypothetical protein
VRTILLGNLIVLAPMVLNTHAGAKYGIPFPVLVRSSFGVKGANIPAVLRALVACGWFGIHRLNTMEPGGFVYRSIEDIPCIAECGATAVEYIRAELPRGAVGALTGDAQSGYQFHHSGGLERRKLIVRHGELAGVCHLASPCRLN